MMAAGLLLYSLYLLVYVINTRQLIANQQRGIMLIIIHWKISINLSINSKKKFKVKFCTLLEIKDELWVNEG